MSEVVNTFEFPKLNTTVDIGSVMIRLRHFKRAKEGTLCSSSSDTILEVGKFYKALHSQLHELNYHFSSHAGFYIQ